MQTRATDQVSPAMRQRYGLDRNPWPARILCGFLVLGYGAVLVLVAGRTTEQQVDARMLVWQQPLPDRVDVTFAVNRPPELALTCVLRAQDADRIDVGYAEVDLPSGAANLQQTYPLRVLGPTSIVELLACGPSGEPMRVPPPAFPPGVAIPEQPWSAE